MIKSLKDLLDKFSRFKNSLVYDGGICKRLKRIRNVMQSSDGKIYVSSDSGNIYMLSTKN